MSNYANNIPRDKGGVPMQDFPAAVKAVATTVVANQVASSILLINPNTTVLEVSAFGGQGTVIRWIPITETAAAAGAKGSVIASGLTANFDHYISPANSPRRFVVPIEQMGKDGQAGSVNGLYQRVAWINAGVVSSSIIASEF